MAGVRWHGQRRADDGPADLDARPGPSPSASPSPPATSWQTVEKRSSDRRDGPDLGQLR